MEERNKNGVREFLVKWKGFGHRDNTWEPSRNLNCDEAIRKFEKEQEKDWEVEKVLESRKKKSGREFLVKWKGYGRREATWEPEKNLNCKDLIKAYEAEHGK